MSKVTDSYILSEPDNVFCVRAQYNDMNENVQAKIGDIPSDFLDCYENAANRLAAYTPGLAPFDSKLGNEVLPVGFVQAMFPRHNKNTMILKMLLNKPARHRFFALLLGVFGNTTYTQTLISKFLAANGNIGNQCYISTEKNINKYSVLNWAEVANNNSEGAPKVNDVHNAPLLWSNNLANGVPATSYLSQANIWSRDLKNEDLFTKIKACEMFPSLAPQILADIPKYVKGGLVDKILETRTSVLYNLLRGKYGIPYETLPTMDFNKFDQYTKLSIVKATVDAVAGVNDSMKYIVDKYTSQNVDDLMSLSRYYRYLRSYILTMSLDSESMVGAWFLNALMLNLAAIMETNDRTESEVLTKCIKAVIDENNLQSMLETWSNKCGARKDAYFNEKAYLVEHIDVPASVLRDTENEIEKIVESLSDEENIYTCLAELQTLHNMQFMRYPFYQRSGGKHQYNSQYNMHGLITASLIPLITNRFKLLYNSYGFDPSILSKFVDGSCLLARTSAAVDTRALRDYPYSYDVLRRWDDLREFATGCSSTKFPNCSDSINYVATITRILTTDWAHFCRVNATKSRDELFDMTILENDEFKSIEEHIAERNTAYREAYIFWNTHWFMN